MTDPVSSPLRAQLQGLNLYLVGMMGAGKSTVGQVLAQQLGYQFFDTDAVIEQATGQAIATLFAELGEPGFREMERRVLGELAAYTRLVVATGGGIVTQPENWGILRQGVVVWLDVPITELHRRLQTDTTRPLLQTGELGTPANPAGRTAIALCPSGCAGALPARRIGGTPRHPHPKFDSGGAENAHPAPHP